MSPVRRYRSNLAGKTCVRALLSAAFCAGCGSSPVAGIDAGPDVGTGGAPGVNDSQPAGWDKDVRLPLAVDTNPDPNVVEVSLSAKIASLSLVPGGPTDVWTYDGLLPGPMIRARRGNRVIVHFANQLPEDTTIHWHGLRVPAAMDGMPGHSQPPVPPGGGFDYDFIVPDASTFWYHPHVNSAKQSGDGLYGAFIVDDPGEPQDLGDEVVMILSDMAVNDDGTMVPPDAGGDLGTLFGREGDLLLVNGKIRPTLKARPGRPQRRRIASRRFAAAATASAFRPRSAATRRAACAAASCGSTTPPRRSSRSARSRNSSGPSPRRRCCRSTFGPR